MKIRCKIESGLWFEQLGKWLSVPGQETEKRGDPILGSEKRMIFVCFLSMMS